jgi:hypothetical protein
MKYTLVSVLLLSYFHASSQKKISVVSLADSVTLTGMVEKFNPAKHRIDTCNDSSENKYVCKIDKKIWYGSDAGLELPRNQLLWLKIKIKNKNIPLNVSGMFNPVFEYKLSANHFKLKKRRGGYILYSFFSDGAGAYTVYWEINNDKSKRVLISTDEKYFSWQFED